jgi:hypothetical protein
MPGIALTIPVALVLSQLRDSFNPFNAFLDHVKVRIHGDTVFERDVRELPYSAGLRLYPKAKQGWTGAVIRCDDAPTPDLVDAQADIFMAIYFSETNIHSKDNGWAESDPIIVVDGYLCGAYPKDILIDGEVAHTYDNVTWAAAYWLHYNLNTGKWWKA